MDLFRHETEVETFPAGAVVLREGTPGDRMYVVREGEVEIRHGDRALARIGPGGMVGEMALVDHADRSATVVALTDATLVPVDEKRFLFLVERTPHFALEVMRTLVRRLREMDSMA